MRINLLFLFILITLLGCTGEESLGVDTQAPNKPQLVIHQGDTGDIIPGFQGDADTLNFYNTFDIDFENNGMDAMMEGDWIKTQWFHLEDSDIDYLKIFRFSAEDYYADTLSFVQIIDTVNYEEQNYYVDKTSMTNKNYFYFIEAFDNAGNSTLSDTTGYKLIEKPFLISPSDNYSCSNINEIIFEWQQIGSNANIHSLLVFNEERELIWQNTPLDQEDFIVPYEGPTVESGSVIIWRVDAFSWSYTTPNPIDGNYYIVESGAESIERYMFID
ncbi:MAG: hypothetical protein HOK80_04375 [Candidatus Cloacimonetes bacterium]|nr:hypothetical protein [Candidatus Cloacimonadota bacterium]